MKCSATLPSPHPIAKDISDRLFLHIQREIQQFGPIPFSRFMTQALYAPELGYYRNPLMQFGKRGDFMTAPVISSLFSYCIANQCAQIGGDIIELGAGDGTMAADILIALQKVKALPNQYAILELSAHLKAMQRETILKKVPDCLNRVIWLDRLPSQPIQGIILANEVLDAMPVELFVWENGPKMKRVDTQHNQLLLIHDDSIHEEMQARFAQCPISFERGYASEINLMLPAWINSMADMLSRGLILLIDYGFPRYEYYHSDRCQGTLMCHYQHRAHSDPLIFPGIQDITAHVDFTAIAEAAVHGDLTVAGFTNQASFLLNCGLLSFLGEAQDEMKRFQQNQQILQLTSPAEMGELFKVMALTKNIDIDLLGFAHHSQLARLS